MNLHPTVYHIKSHFFKLKYEKISTKSSPVSFKQQLHISSSLRLSKAPLSVNFSCENLIFFSPSVQIPLSNHSYFVHFQFHFYYLVHVAGVSYGAPALCTLNQVVAESEISSNFCLKFSPNTSFHLSDL